MENIKKVFITGITGNQGGAVARNLKGSDFQIIGLTRNKNSAKAIELQNHGVQIWEGNLDQLDSFSASLDNMDLMFLVQSMEQGAKSEIEQGKRIVDLAVAKGIGHLVYSSVMGADLNTGIPHFDSKDIIERYIHQSGIDFTILRPASFFENFLNPEVIKRIRKGKLVMPLNKNVVQQLISTQDVGKIAAQIIKEVTNYKGRTISIATDEKSMVELAKCFEDGLKMEVSYQKLPGIFTFLLMGKDLYKMFAYMNKNNFTIVEDINKIRDEFEGLGSLDQWIRTTFQNNY